MCFECIASPDDYICKSGIPSTTKEKEVADKKHYVLATIKYLVEVDYANLEGALDYLKESGYAEIIHLEAFSDEKIPDEIMKEVLLD